jgi:hypothetical protein
MAKERHILKKEIYDEVNGVNRGGFEGGMWFTSFRENYYDKIQDQQDKTIVRDILTKFLKNEEYDAGFLYKVAWICADLELQGHEDEIKRLSADKRVTGTLWNNAFKALLDDIEVENVLIEGISQLECESNTELSRALFNKTVAFFKKLRGDVSKMYGSKDKDKIERTESDFLKSHIYGRLIKLIRSERNDAYIKTKSALILSNLPYSHAATDSHYRNLAAKEIEKLLHNSQIRDSSHINIINQALARIKET